jgi:putative CocE/NonD family hydrolase
LRFFKEHLKDGPVADLPQALLFETGENEWKSLKQWPPAGAKQKFYLQAHGKLSARAPLDPSAFDEYLSDPANPVPYFPNAPQEMVKEYMIADQRFLSDRQDVLSYLSDPLKDDFTMAGPISADLFVATSKSDADFDVKIIDVYSGEAPGHLAGYQQLVRGEPFRGKFRNSFEKPEPFKPDKVEEIRFYMPDVYHCFKKRHRIMVQVESSWFPLTDRNPQTFSEIPNAKSDDFVTATERIYRSRRTASFVEVNLEHR